MDCMLRRPHLRLDLLVHRFHRLDQRARGHELREARMRLGRRRRGRHRRRRRRLPFGAASRLAAATGTGTGGVDGQCAALLLTLFAAQHQVEGRERAVVLQQVHAVREVLGAALRAQLAANGHRLRAKTERNRECA